MAQYLPVRGDRVRTSPGPGFVTRWAGLDGTVEWVRDGNVRVDLDTGECVTCGPLDVVPLCEVSEQPACSRCMRFLGDGERDVCADQLQCERRRQREAHVAAVLNSLHQP